MFVFRHDAWADTVSPIVVFNDWPETLRADNGQQISECAIARSAAFSDTPLALYPSQSYFAYGRYIHAFRLPAYLLLEKFDVGVIRQFYRATAFGVLGMILITQMLLILWRLEQTGDSIRDGNHIIQAIFFIMLSIILMRFYALAQYSPSLTHAPSDILIFLAIAVISVLNISRISVWMFCASCGIFGALVYALEFLHGALPLGLAALIACIAMKADRQSSARQIATTVFVSGSSFVVGACAGLLIKILTLALTFGPQAVIGFFSHLDDRMRSGEGSLSDVLESLGQNLHLIFFEGYRMNRAFLFATGLLLIVAFGIILARAMQALAVQALVLLLSVLVIVVWYSLFRNHTVMHAPFMVRLLVWPLIATAGMVIVALSACARSKVALAIGPRSRSRLSDT